MATVENDTTLNPIRLRFPAGALGPGEANMEDAIKVFKNQKPGTVVVDTAGNYYKCSRWKTSKGEPIWAQISFGGANQQNYSVYVNYSNLTLTSNKNTVYGTEKSKTVKDIRQKIQSQKLVGFYFFVKLSGKELQRIVGQSDYTVGSFLTSDPTDLDDSAHLISRSAQATGTMYNIMRTDSNGRSGPGATSSTDDSTISDEVNQTLSAEAVALINNAYGTGSSSRTDASGYSGFGATASSVGNSGSSSSSSKNTKGGKTKKTKGKPGPQATTTVILKPDKKTYTGSNDFALPYIKQVINHFDPSANSRQRIERIHVFELIPNSFEFSQLSSTWNEVARSGNYPLVDWSNYNLTKVSFRFLVVARKLETNEFYEYNPVTKVKKLIKQTSSIVNDGLLVSIDDQLDNIRAMVGAPAPVTMYNLNTLLSTEYRYPYTNNTRNIQWIINDASITATRLTQDGKAISAAEVSLTLTEYPIVAREIVPLPPLTPDNPPPPPCKPGTGDPRCSQQDPTFGLWVANTYKYLNYASDVVAYPSGRNQ